MRTLDQITALTLGMAWGKSFDGLCALAHQQYAASADAIEVLAEHALPAGLRAYNLARLGTGLCLTTHMGEKRLVFMDADGRFEVGPAYPDAFASMLTADSTENSIVLGAIGQNRLLRFSCSGAPLQAIELCPAQKGFGIWRMCPVEDRVLVICKSSHNAQLLLLAHLGHPQVDRIDCCGILAGTTNRVRYHGGKLYFLQNSGPHVLVAKLDHAQHRLELVDVKALHGCSPMGFDVTDAGAVVAWNDCIIRLDNTFTPTFNASVNGFESMDVLHTNTDRDTFWIRNQDYSALLLARLRPANQD
jgi:hypothetical protein